MKTQAALWCVMNGGGGPPASAAAARSGRRRLAKGLLDTNRRGF
jgi:hypothetical protein